jgi:predicted membrane protein
MLTNWKSTVLGIITLVVTGLSLKYKPIHDILLPVLGVLAGLLGINAADSSNSNKK